MNLPADQTANVPGQGKPSAVLPEEVLRQMREGRLGHWKDLNLPEAAPKIIDRTRLSSDLQSLGDDGALVAELEPPSYWHKDIVGLGTSLFFHVILIAILLLWITFPIGDNSLSISASQSSSFQLDTPFEGESLNQSEFQLENDSTSPVEAQEIAVDTSDSTLSDPTESPPSETGSTAASAPKATATSRTPGGGSLAGRSDPNLRKPNRRMGPSEKTEHAVDNGLIWIAKHQRQDGSWSFVNPKWCKCDKHRASSHLTTAATGMALLTFLGRGYTHQKKGPYQKHIAKGLAYLIKVGGKTGDFTQQNDKGMYGQGIATLVLCEAYAMTRDVRIKAAAQAGIDFICNEAQDPKGGGWRYRLQEPGDMTVSGWQLMALKTAKLSDLKVPNQSLQLGAKFVQSQAISSSGGFTYPGKKPNLAIPGPTAIGVLIRMFNGWDLQEDVLQSGIGIVESHGFSNDDMYYNYYATQVMFHNGGESWIGWNLTMKDNLIATQEPSGERKGSWNFPQCPHTHYGGRLYNTTLAVLMLEVYYRHLKLYDKKALIADFPLED